ncbi:heterokaryon incompatibility protein-domain-containing protein [Diaporthe sp. PMI_573]|nr:heterokaryon incompatibility protein-domain-containing protein [Diaporthaceae sp. PMI_573]
MEPLYGSLDDTKDEVRLLTLDPESRSLGLIHCTLETHSLTAFTADYQIFRSGPGMGSLGKRAATSQWSQSRLAPALAGLAPLRRLQATRPTSSQHRFTWGDYAALSYVWGDEKDTAPIVINGRRRQITANLASALWAFSRQGRFEDGFKLWVDSICINQADWDERARQLRRMRDIYGNAWAVIAWVGDEVFRSSLAIQLIQDLSALSEAQCGPLIEAALSSEPEYLGKGCWLALQEIIDRPYWSRLWIIQEMIMGASATWITCGTVSIDWASFVAGITFLEEHLWFIKDHLLSREMSLELTPETGVTGVPWSGVDKFHLVYSDLGPLGNCEENGGNYPTFGRLLDIANSADCKDPRDKVYGLVGLMPPDVARRLQPDYTLPVSRVYAATARAFIDSSNTLDPVLEGNPWGPSGAPTWAADWLWPSRWRFARTESQLWGPTGFFPGPESAAAPHVPYRASLGTAHDATFSCGGTLLTCSGIVVDAVSGLCVRSTSWFTWDEYSLCQPEGWQSAYGDRTATAEALYRTLVMDRVAESKKASARHAAIFSLPRKFRVGDAEPEFSKRGWAWLAGQESYYHRWEGFRALNKDFRLGEYRLDDFFEDEMPVDASEYDYSEVYSCFVRTLNKRTFMATANGQFGWATNNIYGAESEQVRQGDLIAVLFGCSAPLLIRPAGPYYHVLGEAYIQGLMDGEVLGLLRAGKVQRQQFTFC